MWSGDDLGSARHEAERLVVAALAAATLAANAHPDLATGSAACCVCPFCKIIEAVRDPDPEFVERLATGAGDLAVGIAGLLRNLSHVRPTGGGADARREAEGESTPAAASAAPVKKIAKKALKKPTPRTPSEPATAEQVTPRKAVPKKAARKVVPAESE